MSLLDERSLQRLSTEHRHLRHWVAEDSRILMGLNEKRRPTRARASPRDCRRPGRQTVQRRRPFNPVFFLSAPFAPSKTRFRRISLAHVDRIYKLLTFSPASLAASASPAPKLELRWMGGESFKNRSRLRNWTHSLLLALVLLALAALILPLKKHFSCADLFGTLSVSSPCQTSKGGHDP